MSQGHVMFQSTSNINHHFDLIKRLLRICGISFNRHDTVKYKIYSGFVLSLTLYPFFQIIGAFRYLENGLEIFEFCVFETVMTLIFIKAVVLIRNRYFMSNLLDELQRGVFLPSVSRGGKVEEKILNDCINFTDKQAYVYWNVVTVTVVFAVLDSIYSRVTSDDYRDWRFEYSRVTVFNTSYSPNYEIALIYQNGTWFTVGWTFAVCDLLTVTVLAHITCQLKILQNAIIQIIPNSYKNMIRSNEKYVPGNDNDLLDKEIDPATIPWRYIQPVLKNAVEYHLAIIDVATRIENTFNMLVLLIMLSGIVLIGSLLYRLTVVHVGGVSCILCEIILICYWGNEVSLESQKVLSACYEANFVGSDVRFQKGLFLIMERSKRPITFTAGKFTTLTLGTFLWIARTSYSYLMILRRVSD